MEEKDFWNDLERIIKDIRNNVQNIDIVKERLKELNDFFNNHLRRC